MVRKGKSLVLRVLTALMFLPSALIFPPSELRAQPAGEEQFIQVRSTKLRARPEHWAPSVSALSYGDRVVVLGEAAGWSRAKGPDGKTGFVHRSALSEERVVLGGQGAIPTLRDASDVVLAGKGFNKEVEEAYAASNRALNYTAVDQMEKSRVSDESLAAFIREGSLGTR